MLVFGLYLLFEVVLPTVLVTRYLTVYLPGVSFRTVVEFLEVVLKTLSREADLRISTLY